MPESIWRIEAGTYSLTVKLVRRSMSSERILNAATVSSEDQRKQLQAILGSTSNRGFLSLARDQGIVRQLQLPVDVQQDLKSALTLQIEAISAWPEQDVYWDFIVDRPADKPKWLSITVIIIPKSILDPWLRLFESCNLPLSGATLDGYDVNVIPPALRGGSARAQRIASYVLAACIVLLGIAFLLRGPYQQRVYASQIQREISRLEPDVKNQVREESELNALTKQADLLQKHLKNRDENLEALNTLANVLPPDTFIVSYKSQAETVTITGLSASALNVQSALDKSATFKDVQFASAITRDVLGKDRFTLTMSFKGRP
jgi:general secretion pathway protein L